MAYPTLTRRTEHLISSLVAQGLPLSSAARIAGVPPRTARDWLHQGQRPGAKPHWAEFAESIEDARREHLRAVSVRLEQLRGRL